MDKFKTCQHYYFGVLPGNVLIPASNQHISSFILHERNRSIKLFMCNANIMNLKIIYNSKQTKKKQQKETNNISNKIAK